MKRRDVLKYISASPVAGAVAGIPLAPEALPPKKATRDVIKELGLRTFINAAGTYTLMTGSLMHPEVMETINASSGHFLMLNEVQDKVGVRKCCLVSNGSRDGHSRLLVREHPGNRRDFDGKRSEESGEAAQP